MPYAKWGQIQKHWGLEQRRIYCKGQARTTCSKSANSRKSFKKDLKGKFVERAAGCVCVCVCVSVCVSVCVRERETGRQTFFWLAGGEVNGWYSKNLSHQPSGFCRRILRYVPNSVLYMYIAIPWGGLRTLPHGYTIISWLPFLCFCIPSLCSLVIAWICSLVLREDLGGWSLFPTNEKKGTQKGFCTWKGHAGSCLASSPSLLLSLQVCLPGFYCYVVFYWHYSHLDECFHFSTLWMTAMIFNGHMHSFFYW